MNVGAAVLASAILAGYSRTYHLRVRLASTRTRRSARSAFEATRLQQLIAGLSPGTITIGDSNDTKLSGEPCVIRAGDLED